MRLHLPPGFQYRSFHDTEQPITLDDGTRLPGRHDGMGAFRGRRGNVVLVRNHEINNPGTPFGPLTPYDAAARGGTTTIEVTRFGEVVSAHTSLNGTQMNCSGGQMPWGAWITCEETVNGPDVGPDFTGASNVPLRQPHGFIFEVPIDGAASGEPIRSAGRFAHESVAFDPEERRALPDRGQLRLPVRLLPLPARRPPDARARPALVRTDRACATAGGCRCCA